MNNGHVGRALFVFDPDGNEAEFNTRYLYRPVWCGRTITSQDSKNADLKF
jgi:hypothetical protein